MKSFLAKAGYSSVLALGVFALTLSQAYAVTLKVNCDKGNQTVQKALDGIVDGDTISVSGTCTEIVTIATDGITIRGDPVDGGTLMGGFIVDGAQRVVIDDLTIDGSTNAERLDGVRAQNNAHVTVRNCTILNHTRHGVGIVAASFGLIEGNTITVEEADGADNLVVVSTGSFELLRGKEEKPTQTITSDLASAAFGNSLGVFNDSNARLNGGNKIEGTGNAPAIGVFNDASLRVQNGLNTVTSTKDRAIGIGRLSQVSLRFFDVTGRIDVTTGSHLELRRRLNVEPAGFTSVTAVITGDIRVRSGAQVEFGSPFTARNGLANQGSVTVDGKLLCFGDQGHVSFSTGSGQTIQDVFPSQANRDNSQCNDFNGNPVLPVFGP